MKQTASSPQLIELEDDMPAKTIALEGSDGAGKETQSKRLVSFLESQGKKVARVSFPRYNVTPGGTVLSEVIKSTRASMYNFSKVDPYIASMFYAIDRKESQGYLDRLLEENDVVIFDRYVESNLLHQGGKFLSEEERLSFAEWLFGVEYNMFGLTRPDTVVYLAIPFWLSRKRASSRAGAKGESLDAVESDMEYVRAGHDAGMFYAKHFKWNIIDGIEGDHELSPDEIHLKIINTLNL